MGDSTTINILVYTQVISINKNMVKPLTPVGSWIFKDKKKLGKICFFPSKNIKNKIEDWPVYFIYEVFSTIIFSGFWVTNLPGNLHAQKLIKT